MYVKPSRKQVRGVYVPENYHGTAFDEPESHTPAAPSAEEHREVTAPTPPPVAKEHESAGITSLFSGLGSLRSDDILLLALILLLARSDKNGHGTAEILPMLAILLFIG